MNMKTIFSQPSMIVILRISKIQNKKQVRTRPCRDTKQAWPSSRCEVTQVVKY